MAGFSQATLERIRAASDIVDVIGTYLPLKRAGANFTGLCPFHKEKTPSFNVNPHRQIFHCFGCHKGGDVFTFVKEYENIGFMDSVRRLAERAKIPIEMDASPGEQQARHLKDQLLEIHEKIAQRWQNCLQNEAAGQLARDYLKKRGVGEEAIKLFRIGAAPESWDDTVNWARAKNYDLALVEKTGLIIRKEETGSHYDRFRGRLMFPICDEQGRIVAFSGRVLSGDEKTAKYVNSPETPIFTKSKIFYGLDKSKRAILDAGFAIICEGQLDLIACFMAGTQNIVAPQGTAFTDQHARILKRYVNEVVLCFDSDNAGQNAAVRSLDYLLASGMAVRVAVVPAPHDPDSFIKASGGGKFNELIQHAKGFFDYYLERLCQQNDAKSDKGRLTILRAMAEAVHKTGSAVLTDTYAQKTALRLGVTPEAVRSEFAKASLPAAAARNTEEDEPDFDTTPQVMERPSVQEFWLLKLLLLHDALVDWVAVHLDLNWVSHPLVRQIVEARLNAQKNQSWTNLASFLDQCGSPEMRSLVTEAAAEERSLPNAEKQLVDVILKLRNQFLDRQIAAVMQKAGLPEISDPQKIELLQEQKKLREQKRSQLTATNAA
ncbi:MAG TPA: DNA primase [Candidatus Acidoferrales bacterium]|jgi:DNA primase|nr:DNA primase [Candidatus Acidoferrales bacterium]